MPGPGGGGHSGGGHSGGGHSGGFHGGGGHYGGGHHYGGGFHVSMGGWRPRRRHYGGGCLSNMLGMVIFVIFMIFFLISFLFQNISMAHDGGSVYNYDENKLQDYADRQYSQIFSSNAYEDNLLIVFLTEEDCQDYYYIAWVGDHIHSDINAMLGNNDTELGQALSANIGTYYEYSLDSDLARVISTMQTKIAGLHLESSLTCDEGHTAVTADLVNRTDLPLTEATVEDALEAFADATGIPTAIVVADMEDVFGSSSSGIPVAGIAVVVAIVVIIVVVMVNKVRSKDDGLDDDQTGHHSNVDDQY